MRRIAEGPFASAIHHRVVAHQFLIKLLLCGIGFSLLLADRNFYMVTNPQLWGEDLNVFFLDDLVLRENAILRPHNGSYPISGRLIAYLAGFLPLSMIPLVYTLTYLSAFPLMFFLIFKSSAFRGVEPYFAALFCLIAPVSSEVFSGMLYHPWILCPALGLALYERSPQGLHRLGLVFAYLVVAISAPLAAIVTPFAAVKWFRERTGYALWLLGLSVSSGALMALPMFGRIQGDSFSTSPLMKLGTLLRVFYVWATGPAPASVPVAVAVGLATAMISGACLFLSYRTSRRAIFYLLGCGAWMLVVSISVSPDASQNQFESSGRYYYAPLILALWTALLMRETAFRFARIPVLVACCGSSFFLYAKPASDLIADVHWDRLAKCFETEFGPCIVTANPSFLGRYLIPSRRQLEGGATKDYVTRGWGTKSISEGPLTGQIRLGRGRVVRQIFTVAPMRNDPSPRALNDTPVPYMVEFQIATPEGRPLSATIKWSVHNVQPDGRTRQMYSGSWAADQLQNYETVGVPILGAQSGDQLELVIEAAAEQQEGPAASLILFRPDHSMWVSAVRQDGEGSKTGAALGLSICYRFTAG